MNPNIYKFAHTEYAQDAFIAWLCENYNQNENPIKHQIAEKFIKELLGINIELKSVKVETQVKYIDILLTLNDGEFYVIIEDKKYSGVHDEQLRRYVESRKKDGKTEGQIFLVYYKTGHISATPNFIFNEKTNYYYDSSRLSEKQEVEQINSHYPGLAGLTICSLTQIHNFFKSISGLIQQSGSEILEDYADEIARQYNEYTSVEVDAKEGRRDEIWGKLFDDFILNEAKRKYKNLSFKLDYYSGKYWEIYITGPNTKLDGKHLYNEPILNVRSDIFEGKTQRLYFFFVNDLPRFSSLKKYKMSSSYIIPWGKFKRQHLNNCQYLGKKVAVADIKLLLDAICDEFNRFVIENGEGTFGL